MLLDQVSMKLLNKLYKNDLVEDEVNKIIGPTDGTNLDDRISFLQSEKYISIHKDGKPDGEGGLIDGTVTRTYRILPRGRAVVEQAKQEGVDKWLDRISNLIP